MTRTLSIRDQIRRIEYCVIMLYLDQESTFSDHDSFAIASSGIYVVLLMLASLERTRLNNKMIIHISKRIEVIKAFIFDSSSWD